MSKMSTVEMQVAKRSKEHATALTNLHGFIDEGYLLESFGLLNKKSASGVDGQNYESYKSELLTNIPDLLNRFKSGTYRAPLVKRVYINKSDGKQRPLGLPTTEDKLLQSSVYHLLKPIYEQEFYDFSYGYRENRGVHDALEHLLKAVNYNKRGYLIDADIKNFFGSMDHGCLRRFLDHRINDGVIRKQIDKWLKAGVLEGQQVSYPKRGTPQGGTISPLLSNIYLHYALDKWFVDDIQPRLKGSSGMVRYADDFVLCFANKSDAVAVLKVLGKRLAKYGLTLHPDKTRMVNLSPYSTEEAESFTFVGFKHYMGKSRKGKPTLLRVTDNKRLNLSLRNFKSWLHTNRQDRIPVMMEKLKRKLVGYYKHYGITHNSSGIQKFYYGVCIRLHRHLNNRGGKQVWTWDRFNKLIKEWSPLPRPRIVHKYHLASP